MGNYEKYLKVFMETFKVGKDQAKDLKYQDVDLWDSVGHMDLVANLEDVFEIEMESDEIIDLSSFNKGIDILKKHNIVF